MYYLDILLLPLSISILCYYIIYTIEHIVLVLFCIVHCCLKCILHDIKNKNKKKHVYINPVVANSNFGLINNTNTNTNFIHMTPFKTLTCALQDKNEKLSTNNQNLKMFRGSQYRDVNSSKSDTDFFKKLRLNKKCLKWLKQSRR